MLFPTRKQNGSPNLRSDRGIGARHVQTYFCFKFNRVSLVVSPASDLMRTGNDEGACLHPLCRFLNSFLSPMTQSFPPDHIVIVTGETLTPQQSRTLCEWSQRPLFHAAAPPIPEIEFCDHDDQDDDDDVTADDAADNNDAHAKHMRFSD